MPVRVDCECGQAFAAEDHLVGQQVHCPMCRRVLAVGQPTAARPQAAPDPAQTVIVDCQCGQRLSAPSHLWGLQVPCPNCRASIQVPTRGVPVNWFYWTRVKEHFRHGCANPGIVVGLNPMLIAVYTDLSKGWGEFPTIRIIHKELSTICGQTPQIGTRVASVALYGQMSEDLPHWDEFDPRPVGCATSNVDKIRYTLESFDADDWAELQQGLQHVPQPYAPGQYFLRQLGSWSELES